MEVGGGGDHVDRVNVCSLVCVFQLELSITGEFNLPHTEYLMKAKCSSLSLSAPGSS